MQLSNARTAVNGDIGLSGCLSPLHSGTNKVGVFCTNGYTMFATEVDCTAMELPTIDLRNAERVALASEVDHICRTRGFFQLVGHEIPHGSLLELSRLARVFFALPLEQKLKIRQPTAKTIRGYIPYGKGALANTRNDRSPPDLKESFNVGPSPARQPDKAVGVHCAGNLWPDHPIALRAACSDYYRMMDGLCRRLLRLFAGAAGLPGDALDVANENHVSVLGLAYYPAQEELPKLGQLRSGAHSDFGSVTVLWPETGASGLEVAAGDGQWWPVQAQADALIVSVGDVLEHWTNGRWRSVLHRVVNPPVECASSDRLSIGFFHHPNPQLSMAGPWRARHGDEAMTFGKYLDAKFSSQIRQDA